MTDPSSANQNKSPAQRNIQYIQELQQQQREAIQAARQQTEDKALLRERLSQVVLSRRVEDLTQGAFRAISTWSSNGCVQVDSIFANLTDVQRKGPRAPASALSERAAARKFKRIDSEQDTSRVSVGTISRSILYLHLQQLGR